MSVKLKFRVSHKTEQLDHAGKRLGSVHLYPVSGGANASDENKQFYEFTPGGKIEFSTINQAALDSLPLGGEVYVTIDPA